MAKRATSFALALPLRDSGIPAGRWLYEALRSEILGGRLRPGARLPSTRDLARQYRLARGTIVSSFEQLKSAGVPVVQPPHDTGNNNRNALLRDPDGNLVEIVAKVA